LKYLTESEIRQAAAGRLAADETFSFQCHGGLACFNRCCHNLNLFLYPYDVLRLKKGLGITADTFIDRYVDIVLRPGQHFSEVLLRMADLPEKPCIFLSAQGCGVYGHRPHTCRFFPIEQGVYYDEGTGRTSAVHYFRPPDFCLGPTQDKVHTIASYTRSQDAATYADMTARWAAIRRLMNDDPWGEEGPQGGKARMAFMAAYNIEQFKAFVFQSSFLKRYRVPGQLQMKLRQNENELLLFGFEWIKLFLWGIPTRNIKPY
jgi:Fe-S-cluster containining protein